MKLTEDNYGMYCTACGDCQLWNLSVNSAGYPSARIDGKVTNIRRTMWELRSGRKLGKAQVIGSTCGNSKCLVHLAVSTRGQLTAKAYRDGNRDLAKEYRNRVKAYVARGIAKLDWDKAREIRARREEGALALSKEFGVNKSTITHVLSGKSWYEHAVGATVFAWRGTVAVNEQKAAA
jgi:hypothetical protein